MLCCRTNYIIPSLQSNPLYKFIDHSLQHLVIAHLLLFVWHRSCSELWSRFTPKCQKAIIQLSKYETIPLLGEVVCKGLKMPDSLIVDKKKRQIHWIVSFVCVFFPAVPLDQKKVFSQLNLILPKLQQALKEIVSLQLYPLFCSRQLFYS